MKRTTILRELLSKEKMVVAPGCYDSLSAAVVKHLGFKVVYMTGFGTEGGMLGKLLRPLLVRFPEARLYAGVQAGKPALVRHGSIRHIKKALPRG